MHFSIILLSQGRREIEGREEKREKRERREREEREGSSLRSQLPPSKLCNISFQKMFSDGTKLHCKEFIKKFVSPYHIPFASFQEYPLFMIKHFTLLLLTRLLTTELDSITLKGHLLRAYSTWM